MNLNDEFAWHELMDRVAIVEAQYESVIMHHDIMKEIDDDIRSPENFDFLTSVEENALIQYRDAVGEALATLYAYVGFLRFEKFPDPDKATTPL